VADAGFPPADRDDWLTLAGDIERLRSSTYDGITIEPLYTAADAVADPGLPGHPPYVRGRTATAPRDGWDVRQVVDGSVAGRAVEELERGATSVWIELRHLAALDEAFADDVTTALDGVMLDVAPVVLAAGSRWTAAAAVLAARWASDAVTPVGGSLGADPFGAWASDRTHVDLDRDLSAANDWATRLAVDAPAVRAITIDGSRYHDAGASDGQELGFTIAAAVATLVELSVDPFATIELRLTATADQFLTIAKFRAARRLWSRVAEVVGDPEGAARTPLHAVASTAAMTRYAPAVNMLRATIACFAAAVGGADAITVLPHDALAAAVPSEHGRRLARNTQSVLALESHVARVIDPAGGSWYVERLTDELADAAWAAFQEVEATGGFRAAVEAGVLNQRIDDVRNRRDADIDHRRAPLTGLSEFPDLAESQPVPARDHAAGRPTNGSLGRHRWPERFEALRDRVERHATATSRRPAVYLATVGTPAEFTTAATLARGFFGIAGLDADTGTGGTAGLASAGTDVACVCAARPDDAAAAVEELTAAGARRTYVVGRDPLVAGADAHAALAELLDVLGIE
jgi:methylmalonyl-CoA mutase